MRWIADSSPLRAPRLKPGGTVRAHGDERRGDDPRQSEGDDDALVAKAGHIKKKFTLPIGLPVEMDTGAATLRFLQAAVA